nr:Ig-like domain-containing protein [Lachnospiraceae bacterium]
MSGIDDTEICDSIELSSTELGIIKGASETLTANVGPLTLLDDSVVWTSSDESVATVNEDGVVTAVEKGEAIITATTVAKDKDGKNLTAECKVTVFTINTDLNAIVFDENSEVFFSTINTETRDFTRLSEKQSAPFWSAAVVGDYLYVAEETEDELKSNLYLVDPNTFESILIDSEDETRPWCTDMAYGLVTESLYGTYAYFVPIYTEEGAFDGVFNLSKYTQGEYLVGITYAGYSYIRSLGMYADIFYLIDRSGVIYELDILEDGRFGCVVLGETGITTEGKMKYQSLYYDFETGYIFYSNYDGGEESKLYAIEKVITGSAITGFKTYKLGDFAEKVWPVAGLYRWENQRNDVDDSQVYISGDVTLEQKSATAEFESFVTGERRIPSLSDKPIKKLSEVNAEAAALAQAALEAKANEEAANEEVTEETEETTEETETTTPDESVDGEGEESVSGNE